MKKFLVSFVLLFFVSISSFAVFEDTLVGGRYTALGLADVVKVKDAYGVLYNPSSLGYLEGINFSGNYAEPFGIPGLNIYNANIVVGIPNIVSIGVGYLSQGVDFSVLDGVRESSGYLSVSRSFEIGAIVDSISVGVSGKALIAQVKGYPFDGTDRKDVTTFSADLGVSGYFLGNDLGVSLIGYNIIPATIYFVDANNPFTIPTYIKAGISYFLLKPYMNVFTAIKYDLSISSVSISVGAEISYEDTIFTRLAYSEGKLSGGIGVKGPNFEVNFGTQVRGNNGWYYQIDLVIFYKELFQLSPNF